MHRATNYRRTFAKFAIATCLCLCSLAPSLRAAQGPVPVNPARPFTVSIAEMFTFLFLMLGPIKILGPFVQLTRKGDEVFAKRLAFRAFLHSCAALVFAALVGERSIRNYHISVAVLAIAAGIILFLVALQTVMHQFDPSSTGEQHEYEPSMRLALSPLSFPTIVTPYGVAAVIVFMALTPDFVKSRRDQNRNSFETDHVLPPMVRTFAPVRAVSHGIIPQSNILLAMGGATLLMNAVRIWGSLRRMDISSCCSVVFGWL